MGSEQVEGKKTAAAGFDGNNVWCVAVVELQNSIVGVANFLGAAQGWIVNGLADRGR